MMSTRPAAELEDPKEEVRLGDQRWLSSAELLQHAAQCHSLKELCLRGTCADDVVLTAFLKLSPFLAILDISGCDNITDLSSLPESAPRLLSLRAARCRHAVTPAFIAGLGACSQLEVLDVSHCPGVTGQALKDLALRCSTLTLLNISSCAGVNDFGLGAVTAASSGIRELYISNSTEVTDEGTAKAVRGLKRLMVLDCSACPQLCMLLPKCVAKYCEYLEDLSLASIPDLQTSQVHGIFHGCRRLKRLNLSGCRGLGPDLLSNGADEDLHADATDVLSNVVDFTRHISGMSSHHDWELPATLERLQLTSAAPGLSPDSLRRFEAAVEEKGLKLKVERFASSWTDPLDLDKVLLRQPTKLTKPKVKKVAAASGTSDGPAKKVAKGKPKKQK